MKTPTLTAKKSFKEGHVAIGVQLKSSGWKGDSVKVTGSTDLTTAAARALASTLIELADQADAKTAAKVAANARRQKWCDREIAAGRMIVMAGIK